jgi:putative transposase
MQIIRGFQYRLYPTAEQAEAMARTAGVVRLIYNLALEQRQVFGPRRYGGTRHKLGAKSLSAELSALRKEINWIGAVSQTAQNQALLDLDKAFVNFFEGRAGYPKPRKKFQDDTFRQVGREIDVQMLNKKWGQVKLPKIGWVRLRVTRPLDGDIRSATVRREAGGQWTISISCRTEKKVPPALPGSVGVDRGVVIPYALSTGETIDLPHTIKKRDKSIRRAKKNLSRKKRGSKRYARARVRVARLEARNARARTHVAHEASTQLARRFGCVAIEALNIRQMTASAKGTVESPGVNVRAKSGLNRSILNVGWHRFETLLAYKLDAAGGVLMKVAPHHTSQTCSSCGVTHKDSRKSQALFMCESCGAMHNADTNAAKNILAKALALG